MLSESQILAHIARLPHRSAGYKQLVRELSLRGQERRDLSALLEKLVLRGKLVETARDRYSVPEAATNRNLVAGRLTMHRDGYGFVIPESAEVRQRIEGDIYIAPPNIGAAMHGDQVLVELGNKRGDGRAEGRILRVVNRVHNTIVGTFHYDDRQNYVRPMDEKITMDVIIPRGAEWPEEERVGTDALARPAEAKPPEKPRKKDKHRVIGSEAARKQWDDLEGVVVDVEITDWPSPTQSPRGRVVEILGYEDDFGVDVEIVIRKHHIPHRFPSEALEQAESAEPIISARELKGRRDFRNTPIVTIDGETARDFDDAVTVRRLHNGNFELQVHIADVAHYIREDDAIDREARLRGTSVYFPDRAVPMLPIELSTDICSLRPQVDRLVMSCVMEIDYRGEILGYEITPGVIRSAERMTYTNVHLILEGDKALRERHRPIVDLFELMREVAMILNRKRVKRGSIDFDLPEPLIEFDEQGMMQGVTRSVRNIAHRIIEEFMLAANESVASYLENKQIASLYRIHEKPDPKRVYDFENIAAAFGYSLGVGALPVKRVQFKAERRERYGTGQRARVQEIPEDVHITPRMYQKLTEKIADKPEERILSYLMLRSLKQAKYSERNEGHFALAAPTYTHFTSPIRRYPDLIVHRILKQVLAEDAEQIDQQVPVGIGVIAEANRADASDRDGASSPWSKRVEPRKKKRGSEEKREALSGPIPEEVLHDIAEESSQSERRADDAERELMEWKKVKFMRDRVGEEFEGLIVSITKFGMFVELMDLFIEGLVPLATMTDDHYMFHENTRQLIGQRTKKTYSLGNRVRVILDRIDSVQRKLQFAIVEEQPLRARKKHERSR
jgi:ribonuclease R